MGNLFSLFMGNYISVQTNSSRNKIVICLALMNKRTFSTGSLLSAIVNKPKAKRPRREKDK
jgi:hypothetical protein